MNLFNSVLAETYIYAINCFFLKVDVSLNNYSSPLHKQNKANSSTTFSTFFLSDLFEGTAKPQNCRGKLEPKRNSTIIVLKQIQRPSMDENQMWYLWSMLVVTVCKKRPYGNIVVFYRHKWLKRKYCETAASSQRENKTVHQIGLLHLSWYQRIYSVFVPILNSVVKTRECLRYSDPLAGKTQTLQYKGMSGKIFVCKDEWHLCTQERKGKSTLSP